MDDSHNSSEDKDSVRESNVNSGKSLVEETTGSSAEKQSRIKEEAPEILQTVSQETMSKFIEPPDFVSDKKSYAQYKRDLQLWTRICGIDKKAQAEIVVYRYEGHPSNIKEKVYTQLDGQLAANEDGMSILINFLDGIYTKDDMADAWDKFSEFSSIQKKNEQSMSDFIAEWENSYHKLKTVKCEYSDVILAFKLLQSSKLNEMETKLVLTGVDYTSGQANKTLLKQVKESLKKFKGRPVVMNDDRRGVQIDDTYVSQLEEVLVARGWKPPGKERRRSRSLSPPQSRSARNTPRSQSQPKTKNPNYKGKKNALGEDRKPMKCHKCKCSHTENCNCPCVYHFAPECPGNKPADVKKKVGFDDKKKDDDLKSVLGLFIDSNVYNNVDKTFLVEEEIDSDDDLVLIAKDSLHDLVLINIDKSSALIDCACPTTVTGKKWMVNFVNSLSDNDKQLVKLKESKRVYKFGGGEKRKSIGVVIFPCHIAGKNVKLQTEVVDAEFPLLLGNTMLKAAKVVLYLSEKKARVMDVIVEMKETNSGHFSINIDAPKSNDENTKDKIPTVETYISSIKTYVNASDKPLQLEDIKKIHHYFGHLPQRKLEDLIRKANKLTKEVQEHIEQVITNCDSCITNQRGKPRPIVALPRASQFNQVVSLDLKHYHEGDYRYIFYLVDLFSRLIVGGLIRDKQPSTVAENILAKWIAPMGRMDTIHSDRGGEFCCDELTKVAEYLGIKSTLTAAYSPQQNGANERNHAICDNMMKKMRSEDPSLTADVALTWALVAKNSLDNISGFSPFQIVFGEQPKLPSVYTAGPPGMEEVVMNKAVADHINALFLAREAYTAGESDRILKAALKQRIYKRGEDVKTGDWIYFNKVLSECVPRMENHSMLLELDGY